MVQNSSIHHNIPLIPQPDRTTCWAATIAMLKGRTVQQIRAATPPDLLLPDGSLRNYSGQQDWVTGTRRFAAAHKLKYAAPQSWSTEALHAQLAEGPIAFDLLWQAGTYTSGSPTPGHLVLLIGMSGSGGSTTVTFNDPWPPRRGDVVTRNLNQLYSAIPTLTYRVFWQ